MTRDHLVATVALAVVAFMAFAVYFGAPVRAELAAKGGALTANVETKSSK